MQAYEYESYLYVQAETVIQVWSLSFEVQMKKEMTASFE